MKPLSDFIYRQIEKQAKVSLKDGKAKYRVYFVDTRLYESNRKEVDAAITAARHKKVITTE